MATGLRPARAPCRLGRRSKPSPDTFAPRPSMARTLRSHRLAAAASLAVAALVVVGGPVGAGAPAPAQASTVGTPLPAGWELCILQGVAAPVTSQNVANLDEWQLAEGGSTNNTAAYNPYKTH